jgi:glutathione synthase/RimK-type ligase-like ATP-grasp enzyme
MNLRPSWVNPGGLFVITTPTGDDMYINNACSPLNPQANASLVKNKYNARLIMARHDLPNIPFARPQTLAEAVAFLEQHGTIIVKPLRGYGAQDIHIISDMSKLEAFTSGKYIFEKYIAGTEMRYLVIGNDIVAVHESEYGTSVSATRELQRISYPPDEWDPVLSELSLRIAAIFGLQFAAVDYMISADGRIYILEVNTTPGLKWFHAPTTGPPIDVATLFLQAILEDKTVQIARPAKPRWLSLRSSLQR